MNNTYSLKNNHSELINKIESAFEDSGWECFKSDDSSSFDITLKKNNEIYGYVEICTYFRSKNINPNAIKTKIDHIQNCIEIQKPPFFVLTDGIAFENYFDGVYYSTTHFPLGYVEFSEQRRMRAYFNKFEELKRKENPDE